MKRCLLGLLVLATPAGAETNLAELDMKAAAFTGAVPGHEGGARAPIDRRMHLADCARDPALSWRTDRHDAVVVECAGPTPWRIFVPVLRTTTPAIAAVAAGAPALPARKAEPVIRRGDAVTIGLDQGGFTITQDGTAMGDAAPGDRLQVRIDGAKAPVQAVAVAAGQATLPSA